MLHTRAYRALQPGETVPTRVRHLFTYILTGLTATLCLPGVDVIDEADRGLLLKVFGTILEKDELFKLSDRFTKVVLLFGVLAAEGRELFT